MTRYLYVLLVSLLSTTACADIYRWYDEEGTLNYGDRPPAGVQAQKLHPRQPASATANPATARPSPTIQQFLNKRSTTSLSPGQSRPLQPGVVPVIDEPDRKADHRQSRKFFQKIHEVKIDHRERRQRGADNRIGSRPLSNRIEIPKTLSQKRRDQLLEQQSSGGESEHDDDKN